MRSETAIGLNFSREVLRLIGRAKTTSCTHLDNHSAIDSNLEASLSLSVTDISSHKPYLWPGHNKYWNPGFKSWLEPHCSWVTLQSLAWSNSRYLFVLGWKADLKVIWISGRVSPEWPNLCMGLRPWGQGSLGSLPRPSTLKGAHFDFIFSVSPSTYRDDSSTISSCLQPRTWRILRAGQGKPHLRAWSKARGLGNLSSKGKSQNLCMEWQVISLFVYFICLPVA